MKLLALLPAATLVLSAAYAQVPKPFAGLFEKDVPVRGQIGVPMPPPEIHKYIAKVEAAAEKDMKWFREYSAQAKTQRPPSVSRKARPHQGRIRRIPEALVQARIQADGG